MARVAIIMVRGRCGRDVCVCVLCVWVVSYLVDIKPTARRASRRLIAHTHTQTESDEQWSDTTPFFFFIISRPKHFYTFEHNFSRLNCYIIPPIDQLYAILYIFVHKKKYTHTHTHAITYNTFYILFAR